MRPPKCLSFFFWLNVSIWLFARHSSPMLRSDLRWSEIMIRNGLKSLRFLVMAGWTPQKSWLTKVKSKVSQSITHFYGISKVWKVKGKTPVKKRSWRDVYDAYICELFLNHPRWLPKTSLFSLSGATVSRDTLYTVMVCVIFAEHEISGWITCSNSFYAPANMTHGESLTIWLEARPQPLEDVLEIACLYQSPRRCNDKPLQSLFWNTAGARIKNDNSLWLEVSKHFKAPSFCFGCDLFLYWCYSLIVCCLWMFQCMFTRPYYLFHALNIFLSVWSVSMDIVKTKLYELFSIDYLPLLHL